MLCIRKQHQQVQEYTQTEELSNTSNAHSTVFLLQLLQAGAFCRGPASPVTSKINMSICNNLTLCIIYFLK